MNKKIILSIVATALVASSLVAFNGQGQMQQGNNQGPKQGKMMQGKMMKGQQQKGPKMFVRMVMRLDLTDKQRTDIQAIVKKSMADMVNPHDAFTDTSFNKKEFIKLAKEKRDSKIERAADMIEKVYTVLNSSQKKDLKTMLDMKDLMKKNMIAGKNCKTRNGNAIK
jgi:hypothetical protein